MCSQRPSLCADTNLFENEFTTQGSLSMAMDAGTRLMDVLADTQSVTKILDGRFTATGTADYTGSITVEAGQCFDDNSNTNTEFPFQSLPCPAP